MQNNTPWYTVYTMCIPDKYMHISRISVGVKFVECRGKICNVLLNPQSQEKLKTKCSSNLIIYFVLFAKIDTICSFQWSLRSSLILGRPHHFSSLYFISCIIKRPIWILKKNTYLVQIVYAIKGNVSKVIIIFCPIFQK